MRIGQPIVHGVHARGVAIAQIGDLDRCGLPGKDKKAVARRVTGQIHEDINPVRADEIGCLLVLHAGDLAPLRCVLMEPFGNRVLTQDVGVAKYFDLAAIVSSEQTLEEECNWMFPKVRRDVADPQSPLRIPIVAMTTDEFCQRQ